MKVASAVAAASAAITAVASYSAVTFQSPSDPNPQAPHWDEERREKKKKKKKKKEEAPPPPLPEDRFAPRFDGLRFIETLITAHR